MNSDSSAAADHSEMVYSVEIIAELAGISPKTVLRYHELGVISSATENLEFDTEGLRKLRRAEHLRTTHELTESGLKFISDLLTEVEQLRHELRQIRHKRF
jgi:DNA-binding transcriptional MerR regulator